MNMRKMISSKGFTLLEVLLSLTVIIALTLVFIPTMQKMQQQRNMNAATLQMNSIANAASQYYSMYQVWPQNLNVLNKLLGYTGPTPNPFCSVWRNALGCAPYTMVSSAATHYFALAVVVPSPAVALQLAKNLPVAYVKGTTVTAYTTVFRGFKPPPPTGVLLSATSQQLAGVCHSGNPTSVYAGAVSPFPNCIEGSNAPGPLPYGLIDVAQYQQEIVSGNNYGGTNGYAASSFYLTDFKCPVGTAATMLYLPVGVFSPVATGIPAPTVDASWFINSGAHFITQGNAQKSCVSSLIGTDFANTGNGNYWAGFGDVVCLPDSALTRWPDGLSVSGCYANQ